MPKISQKNLISRVYQSVVSENLVGEGDTVIVGLSGGPDSVCLFDILLSLRDKLNINIKACHFNHKLRGEESEADEKFVEKLCKDSGTELIVGEWENKPRNKKASEDEARRARYDFFSKISISDGGVVKIALAHNSNDLAETFLMRIIRGTGLKGLKSIPSSRENFIRPLLKFSRDDIMDYIIANNIKHRTDKSNVDLTYFRNQIRHKLLPDLKEFNPNIVETLGGAILAIGDDYDYISAEAEKKLISIVEKEVAGSIILDYEKWLLLHPALQRLTIRLSIERLGGGEDINFAHIEKARGLLIKKVGKKSLPLPHHLQIRLERGRIIILNTKMIDIKGAE
jgi:tRNA(Ile)-lysidine synthase